MENQSIQCAIASNNANATYISPTAIETSEVTKLYCLKMYFTVVYLYG